MTGLDDDLSNVGERGWAGGAKEFISDKGFCQPALTAGMKGGERFGGNVECSMGLDVLQRERERSILFHDDHKKSFVPAVG